MTILLILVCAAFTGAMVLQTVRTLLERRGESATAVLLRDDLRQLEELVAERALVLSALRELELDRELDKISEQDYLLLKRRHERQAVQIMRRLDDLYGGRGWESAIERELTQRLESSPAVLTPATTQVEEVASDEAALFTTPETPDAACWACPACARVMRDDDMFCSRCGTSRPSAPALAAPQADSHVEQHTAPTQAVQEPATP
jgi:hypothetical protein